MYGVADQKSFAFVASLQKFVLQFRTSRGVAALVTRKYEVDPRLGSGRIN